MPKTAFLFPGQGAQTVGMGKDLYEAFPSAREYFDRAERATGLDLKQLCFDGPAEQLDRTDICQPAIFTVSAATLAVMKDILEPQQYESIRPDYMAGLSLGEYTALYGAGAMDFETGVKLVTERGRLMQQAALAVPSGMVSVIGLDAAQAAELCQVAEEEDILSCANFNCPGQIVLSGQADACRRVIKLAGDYGATAAVELKVAGAFHSKIMSPAAEAFSAVLETVRFQKPHPDVLANTDATAYIDADEIAPHLLDQLTQPVRWQESMENLLALGVEKLYEIGPGRVLAGLMRRIHRRADFTSLNSRRAVEKLLASDK